MKRMKRIMIQKLLKSARKQTKKLLLKRKVPLNVLFVQMCLITEMNLERIEKMSTMLRPITVV